MGKGYSYKLYDDNIILSYIVTEYVMNLSKKIIK